MSKPAGKGPTYRFQSNLMFSIILCVRNLLLKDSLNTAEYLKLIALCRVTIGTNSIVANIFQRKNHQFPNALITMSPVVAFVFKTPAIRSMYKKMTLHLFWPIKNQPASKFCSANNVQKYLL